MKTICLKGNMLIYKVGHPFTKKIGWLFPRGEENAYWRFSLNCPGDSSMT